jgi:hypothetical protein
MFYYDMTKTINNSGKAMRKFTKQALAVVAIAAFAIAGCKKGSEGDFNRSNGTAGPFDGADSVITGNITASRTLSPENGELAGPFYSTDAATQGYSFDNLMARTDNTKVQ